MPETGSRKAAMTPLHACRHGKNLWMIQRSPSEGQDLSLPWPEWDPLHAHRQRHFKGSLGECVCAYNCDCGLCKQRWDDARKLSWFLPSGEHLTQTIWQASIANPTSINYPSAPGVKALTISTTYMTTELLFIVFPHKNLQLQPDC